MEHLRITKVTDLQYLLENVNQVAVNGDTLPLAFLGIFRSKE